MPRARILGLAALLALPFGAAAGRAAAPSPIVFSADRAPLVTGEIYRLDPNGHRVDLSNSPYQDMDPVVSPDGMRVAFLSNRSGREGVYEVGIDGRGLVRVAPSLHLPLSYPASLAWQPHGSLLAVAAPVGADGSWRVWIVRPHRKPLLVSGHARFGAIIGFGTGEPWSPDGRILLLSSGGGGIRAVTPQGRTLWSAAASRSVASWSPDGLVAVPLRRGGAVYDENGRLRFEFRLPLSPSGPPVFTWSPNGRHLAVYWSYQRNNIEVLTADGTVALQPRRVSGYEVGWASNSRVVIGFPNQKTIGIDLRTKKVSSASSNWLEPLSANRKLAIVTSSRTSGFELGTAPSAGGSLNTYAQVPACFSDGVRMAATGPLQFAGRSIVYQSWWECDPPYASLYSSAPDGSGLRRLTDSQAQETQPAVSPDTTKIAFVWAQFTGLSCKGCSDGIRVVNADGSSERTLTNPDDCTFDDSPTWSPDGSTILFTEDECDSPGELYTVAAAGGTPHDLGVAGTEPAWGPSRIAYVGPKGLFTANTDGSDPVAVAAKGKDPAWSADGRLAYRTGGFGRTVVVGSTSTQLPFASVTSLVWSPDGTRFVVTARKTKTTPLDVFTVRTDGTDPVELTRNYNALGVSW